MNDEVRDMLAERKNFSNLGYCEEGGLIGNCDVCGTNGVLVNDHVGNCPEDERWQKKEAIETLDTGEIK